MLLKVDIMVPPFFDHFQKINDLNYSPFNFFKKAIQKTKTLYVTD